MITGVFLSMINIIVDNHIPNLFMFNPGIQNIDTIG